MARKKYYVVWVGKKTGVFETWQECKENVHGFPNAKYKSFPSRELAQKQYDEYRIENVESKFLGINQENIENNKLIDEPIWNSISVDGSWNTETLVIEYQGVKTKTKELLFRIGPLKDGTNNIAEFLALVHALAYCKKNNIKSPIYSDSQNAISWVRAKKARTKLEATENNDRVFELIERAEKWLKENKIENEILKWRTRDWGENPADFGRK